MSKGDLGQARFCPWCGTESLMRDYFNQSETHHANSHVSFICTSCNRGFSINNSPRVMFAHRMIASERRIRPPK